MSFIIEDVEDYGQYGLEKPVCTIDLEAGEESWQIQLGDYSKMDSKRYVSIGDGNVYLVNSDPMDLFDTTLNALIANDQIPYWEQVSEISFEGRTPTAPSIRRTAATPTPPRMSTLSGRTEKTSPWIRPG